jgi:acylphosphatase
MSSAEDAGEVCCKARVRVRGRVQGVFFRASTQTAAAEFGVTGHVRNCSDFSVEFVAYGPPKRVDALINWAHTGPAMADVTSIVIEEPIAPVPVGENVPDVFEIRR